MKYYRDKDGDIWQVNKNLQICALFRHGEKRWVKINHDELINDLINETIFAAYKPKEISEEEVFLEIL